MARILFILLLSLSLVTVAEAKNKTRKELIREARLKQHQSNIEFRNRQIEKRKAFIAQMDKEEEEYIKSGKRDPNHKKERAKKRQEFNEQMNRELEVWKKEQQQRREARLRR